MNKLLALIFLLISGYSLGETANIIDLPGAPLQIRSYEALHQVVGGPGQPQGVVRHEASVSNGGNQDVTAFSMGFLAFNSFNEYMGPPLLSFWMEVVEAGSSSSRPLTGMQKLSNALSFQGYGTAFAYVRQARLEDGTVWEADLDLLLEELRKFQNSLSRAEISESQFAGE